MKRPRLATLSALIIGVHGFAAHAGLDTSSSPPMAADSKTNDFEQMRQRWVANLVGDQSSNPAAPLVRERVQAQAQEAQVLWMDMVKTPTDDLWPELRTATHSAGLTATCGRLTLLAKAYATPGSALYHQSGLLSDLIMGLHWFATVRYHPGAKSYDNWWDWQIGVPLALLKCLACVSEDLPTATMHACTDAIEAFTPQISATGANGSWRAEILFEHGLLVGDAAKLTIVRDWMEKAMLPYFESPPAPAAGAGFDEGFYRDGSFFAHGRYPYNAGYGLGALASAAQLLTLAAGTPWDVRGPQRDRVYEWVVNAFEPFLFRGNFFDNMRGREISRGSATHPWPETRDNFLESLLNLLEAAPDPFRQDLRALVKEISTRADAAQLAPPAAAQLLALQADASIPIPPPAVLFRFYPLMARAVMLRPGFGASVSMYSDWVYDYESLNQENLQGWHTGDGWLQIRDVDANQFTGGFWPTVDWHRLPGVTAVRDSTKPSGRFNGSNWAGGVDFDGVNGSAGFELRPFFGPIYDPGTRQTTDLTDGQTLTARKSWFLCGDEIFCVGSGIAAQEAQPVETTLENRRLEGAGENLLTIDGQPIAPAAAAQTLTAHWWQLEGNVPGSSLGCVLAQPACLHVLREARVGTWKTINANCDSIPLTERYLTLWLDHGVRPADARYAYVLLPGRTAAEVAQYAAQPSIRLLSATNQIHAIAQTKAGLIAANFWEDAPATLSLDGPRQVTANCKACVFYRHEAGVTELAISDPTRANRTGIQLTLNIALGRVLAAGKYLRAETSAAGTVVTLDLSHVELGDRGRTFKIKLAD